MNKVKENNQFEYLLLYKIKMLKKIIAPELLVHWDLHLDFHSIWPLKYKVHISSLKNLHSPFKSEAFLNFQNEINNVNNKS